MSQPPPPKKPANVKVFRADTSLQAKVGMVTVKEEHLVKAQKALEESREAFTPLALQMLDKLDGAIVRTKADPLADNSREDIIQPVMQLKANAKMFDYDLITSLANIMLGFLESVDHMDNTILEIVAAHAKTLRLIVDRELKGDGGPVGQKLESELRSACMRYLAKKQGD